MIDITRCLIDGCGTKRSQQIVEELDTRAAMSRLVFDFLPNTVRVFQILPNAVSMEVGGPRRTEQIHLTGFSYQMFPLALVARQYLLILENREAMAKQSLLEMRRSPLPNLFNDKISICYEMPALPGSEWDDLVKRYPEEVALFTALSPVWSHEAFEWSMVNRKPQDHLGEIVGHYEYSQNERFNTQYIRS